MINIYHLLWIVPLAATAGYFLAALCRTAKAADDIEPRPWDVEPFLTPIRTARPVCLTAVQEVSLDYLAAKGDTGVIAVQGVLAKKLVYEAYKEHLIQFVQTDDPLKTTLTMRAQLQVLPPERRADNG